MLNISKYKIKRRLDDYPMHSIKLVSTPRSGRLLGRSLLIIMGIIILIMFLPWQQNVNTRGVLTALSPSQRPQTLQSPIAGRIEKWFHQEGDKVKKGDTILLISEIKEKFLDPNILVRLEEQIAAKEGVVTSNLDKADALTKQVTNLTDAQRYKLDQARNKVKQARFKIETDSTELQAVKIQLYIADTQFVRSTKLFEEGVISKTSFENRKQKFNDAVAKLIAQENKLLDSKNVYLNAVIDLSGITAEYGEKIAKSESERSATLAYIEEAKGEVSKLKNEYTSTAIRSGFYFVRAPQDGYMVRALRVGIGETIKEGDALATIMPDNPPLAVELFVKALDVSLLRVGDKVRLQFDGWPALVFSGWPGVTVGTFGGVVKVIDYVDSKEGKFRILVVPDPEDNPWPPQVRVGTGTYGWAMLRTVPIWYEVWRQLNGFPPDMRDGMPLINTTGSETKK